jgi:tetratricopeptide (TPR) repeat protein
MRTSAACVAFVLLAGCARRDARVETHAQAVARGWDLYRLSAFDAATRVFRDTADAAPRQDPWRLQALYGLASTWNLRRPGQNPPRAERIYREIVSAAPDSDMAAWSLLALARMRHLVPVGETPDYAAVRQAYTAVIRAFPDHLAGQEAFIYLQAAMLAEASDPQAAQAVERQLRGFVDAHPASGFLSSAWSLLSVCYERLRRPDEWLHAERQAMTTREVDAGNPKQDRSWSFWRIATIAEFEVGDFDLARRYYRLLMETYPRDIRVYPAAQALERMDATEATLRAEGRRARGGPP